MLLRGKKPAAKKKQGAAQGCAKLILSEHKEDCAAKNAQLVVSKYGDRAEPVLFAITSNNILGGASNEKLVYRKITIKKM